MRFVLDEDTDAGVCVFLRKHRHECWTAPAAGRDETEDDEIAVYADTKRAIMVSHDKKLAKRRMKHTFGQHVWLRCRQTDAIRIVKLHYSDLIAQLAEHPVGVFEVTLAGVEWHRGSWGTL